jgi:hypothetical protein
MGSIYKRGKTYSIKYYDNGKPIYKSSKSKTKMVESIQNQTGFAKTRLLEIVETLFEIIKRTPESSEDVLVSGFGNFVLWKRRNVKAEIQQLGRI